MNPTSRMKIKSCSSFLLVALLVVGNPPFANAIEFNLRGMAEAAPLEEGSKTSQPSKTSGPVASKETDQQEILKTIVSLNVEDEQITGALKGLAKAFQLNIVSPQEISQKVTLNLRDVALGDVLDAMFTGSGYTYSVKGNLIEVVNLKSELTTQVIELDYAKANEVKSSIENLLSKEGSIKIDSSQNRLIVTDYPANLREVAKAVEKFDAPTPQVLIEARLVDVSDTDLSALGVKWTGNTNLTGSFDTLKSPLTSRTLTIPGSTSTTTTSTNSQDYLLNLPETSSDLSGGQLVYGLTGNRNVFSATIDALIRKNKAHILASPSITTLHNQEAKIIIGEKVPFRESNLTAAGTTETTRFIDVGITLRVTPRIGRDDYITMELHPEVSSVSELLSAGPRITTREASTTVMVKNGQTVVIAGLIRNENTVITQKIPLLGSIPGVGLLFRNKSTKLLTTELAVFVTPYIMRPITTPKDEPVVDAISPALFYNRGFRLMTETGIESFGKSEDQRLQEAVAGFQVVTRNFPESEQADDAYYYIGKICYEKLKKYKEAAEAWETLKTKYPNSSYIDFGFNLRLNRAKRLAKKNPMKESTLVMQPSIQPPQMHEA